MPSHSRSRSRRKRRSRGPSSNRKSRSRNHTQSPGHRPRSARGLPRNANQNTSNSETLDQPSTSYHINEDKLTDLNDVLEDPSVAPNLQEDEEEFEYNKKPGPLDKMGLEEQEKLEVLHRLIENMEKQFSPPVSGEATPNVSTPEKKAKSDGGKKSSTPKVPKAENNMQPKKSDDSTTKKSENTSPKKTDNVSSQKTKSANPEEQKELSQEEKAALRKQRKENKKKDKQNKEPAAPPPSQENENKENVPNSDAANKSKADLKRERREKQEAQRAAKIEQQKAAEAKKQPSKEQPKQVSKAQEKATPTTQSKPKPKPTESSAKKMPLVGHLCKSDRQSPETEVNNVIHSAIKRIGIEMKIGTIDGCNARVLATLDAFKQIVDEYRTPKSTELSRDLAEKLSCNVKYLKDNRMMTPSMENAVRSLKNDINNISPSLSEVEAKKELLECINSYITNNIRLASTEIKDRASKMLQDGDVLLTYGFSNSVYEIIESAVSKGLNLTVVVADNSENTTGIGLLYLLDELQVETVYTTLTNLPNLIETVTKVIVEAEAVLLNGAVVGPVGQAGVSMMAHHCGIPVIVLCHTYKFCNNDLTDSLDNNELGSEEKLLQSRYHPIDNASENLYVANLCFDITPPEIVTSFATERGILATSSVPVIIRRNFADVLGHN